MDARRFGRGSTVVALLSVIAGCADDRSVMEIRARAPIDSEDGLAGIRVLLNETLYGARDFAPGEGGLPRVRADVPSDGFLRIDLVLYQGGEVVAGGGASIAMQGNFEWGLDVFRQIEDPLDTCMGCFRTEMIPIGAAWQNEPGEAVWLAWGGRARGSDIIY
ncbi:MAG: hypothetical protein OEZ65_09090 [Gemmatimonadota bacterium]|nr:hypothetical protein [Gemmatimonadota bacterium]MDH5759728.1 hypothetical protein [Gemmatimonadota bacterium]